MGMKSAGTTHKLAAFTQMWQMILAKLILQIFTENCRI